MPNRCRNLHLGALLTEAAWTSASLARAVNALGAQQGLSLTYDRTSVAHWLSGARPRRPVPDLVADALTGRLGRLVTPDETGLTKPFPALPPDAPASTASGLQYLIHLWQTDADLGTQAQITKSPYTLTVLNLPPWTAGPGPAPAPDRPPTPPSPTRCRSITKWRAPSLSWPLSTAGGPPNLSWPPTFAIAPPVP